MKIIITDDSAIMRKIISRCLTDMGYDIIEAENGQEALNAIDSNKGNITLVFLDWNMPIMSGFEALRAIKSNPETKGIPVIMATTESSKSDILKAIQTVASGYIVKPFQKETIIAKVKSVLKL